MPDDIRLVRPRTDVRRSYNEASAELRAAFGRDTAWPGNRVWPGVEFGDAELRSTEGFARFVAALHRASDPSVPAGAGWVHSTMFWLVDFAPREPRYLGRLSLRHELTGFLRTEGGHIGYVVRPSAQRRGLGTRMLAMGLPASAARGIDSALVTCDVDNVGSAKVIVANGGVEDAPYRSKRRFWVPTRPRLAAMQPDLPGVLAAQVTVVRDWIAALSVADIGTVSVLAGHDPVVVGARGPILLSDFVTTRLVELVVHADDLGRSLGRPGPQDPRAVDVAAAALVQVWADRFPRRPLPEVDGDLDWIRQACGRIRPPVPVDGLPLL